MVSRRTAPRLPEERPTVSDLSDLSDHQLDLPPLTADAFAAT